MGVRNLVALPPLLEAEARMVVCRHTLSGLTLISDHTRTVNKLSRRRSRLAGRTVGPGLGDCCGRGCLFHDCYSHEGEAAPRPASYGCGDTCRELRQTDQTGTRSCVVLSPSNTSRSLIKLLVSPWRPKQLANPEPSSPSRAASLSRLRRGWRLAPAVVRASRPDDVLLGRSNAAGAGVP